MSGIPATQWETIYGFGWNNMEVSRMFSDPQNGSYLSIKTPKGEFYVRVTPSGNVFVGKSDGTTAVSTPILVKGGV